MSRGEGKGFPRFVLSLVICAAILAAPVPTHAAVVTPNTTADEYDLSPDATCSLREAVKSADGDSNFGGCVASGAYGTDTVELPSGTYVLTIPPSGGDLGDSGDLNTFSSMSIQSASGAKVTIEGSGSDRILFASVLGATITLKGLVLTNGNVNDPNLASAVNGGAIATSSGTGLMISDTTISGNSADGVGGAIAANGATSLTNVTISGNTSTESGGGGIWAGGASLSLDHVTVTDNHSQVSTMGASSTTGGVGISGLADATALNSLIAGNTSASPDSPSPDCEGSLTSQGGNVLGDSTGCDFTSTSSDAVGSPTPLDPMLGPLADNGGTTPTHALLSGSPAIDRGIATCASTDQRGYPRPTAGCDSGAYEVFLCGVTPLNAPGPFLGCPVTPVTPPPTVQTQPGTRAELPLCGPLRKKLRKARKAHNKAKVKKLRKKLRNLGCA